MKIDNYEEFLEIAKDVADVIEKDDEHVIQSDEVEVRGATGGDCWGGTASYYECGEPTGEIKFIEFDEIIEKVCPEISFIRYRNLREAVTNRKTTGGHADYYGNFSECVYDQVNLKDLFTALGDRDLI